LVADTSADFVAKETGMTRLFISLIGMLLTLGSAQAQTASASIPKPDVSTEAMVKLCKNKSDQLAQTFCFGFGEGVYQASLLGNGQQKPTICVPESGAGTTRDQVLAEFLTWVDANPQLNKEPAAAAVMKFLPLRFPCKG
jgi:hypothetical protein